MASITRGAGMPGEGLEVDRRDAGASDDAM